jgi:hypothetical protein
MKQELESDKEVSVWDSPELELSDLEVLGVQVGGFASKHNTSAFKSLKGRTNV